MILPAAVVASVPTNKRPRVAQTTGGMAREVGSPMHDESIPYGYCECGCGQRTPIAQDTNERYGRVKGQPTLRCLGHGRAAPLDSRFEAKVDRSPGQGPKGECHLWTATTVKGYGWIHVGADLGRAYAHRVAWFLATGEWPTLHVLHRCDTPGCVRFEHLFLGSQTDNIRDMHAKGRGGGGGVRGAGNGRARSVDAAAIQVAAGTQRAIAERFGTSERTVGRIKSGEHWATR